jgi:hypothetical protein
VVSGSASALPSTTESQSQLAWVSTMGSPSLSPLALLSRSVLVLEYRRRLFR